MHFTQNTSASTPSKGATISELLHNLSHENLIQSTNIQQNTEH